jgi:hypothetical protein
MFGSNQIGQSNIKFNAPSPMFGSNQIGQSNIKFNAPGPMFGSNQIGRGNQFNSIGDKKHLGNNPGNNPIGADLGADLGVDSDDDPDVAAAKQMSLKQLSKQDLEESEFQQAIRRSMQDSQKNFNPSNQLRASFAPGRRIGNDYFNDVKFSASDPPSSSLFQGVQGANPSSSPVQRAQLPGFQFLGGANLAASDTGRFKFNQPNTTVPFGANLPSISNTGVKNPSSSLLEEEKHPFGQNPQANNPSTLK